MAEKDNKRDKYLTLAKGECWHVYKRDLIRNPWVCWKCGHSFGRKGKPKYPNDFSTWEGFGKLWEWCQRQEWWIDFVFSFYTNEEFFAQTKNMFPEHLINPNSFAEALYEFLRKED